MAIQNVKKSINIPIDTVQKIGGMVILSLREYKKLCEKVTPMYQLKGKEASEVDNLVRDGQREYKAGKCKTIKSLADLD